MNLLVKFFCARRGRAEAHSDLRRIMTDRYLTTVLKEAERVAEQHDQVARTADNQAHEYLRYAVPPGARKRADHLPSDWTPIDGVTVGYGEDEAMFDSWGSSEDWWETQSRPRKRVPASACSSRRPPDGSRDIVDVMAALGTWRVWTGRKRNRVAPTTIASAVRSTTCGRKAIRWRKCSTSGSSSPAEAVAPDGGRTGDVRDRLVVDDDPQPQDDLEPRTKRAIDEAMDVSLLLERWSLRGPVRVR